jgi:aryl-alcohol dehydrogenase-like predicted oxidoreductase
MIYTAGMQYRWLGRTGVKVSSLCLGTMSFGGDSDDAASAALFRRAREAGINIFDCANVYNGGRSEEILGRLVEGCRDEIVLATKAYFPSSEDVNARGGTRYHLVRAVEASLRRLRTDRIDLFYLHRFDEKTPLEETMRAVEDLVRQGKVLYPAVSNFAAWQTARALGVAERSGWSPIACVQPMYNLVKRQAECEILPLCAAEQLGCFPYSPLGGGLLSGKYGISQRPDRGRLVDWPMYATRYAAADYYEIAQRFCEVAKREGEHPATLAVAWVASHPQVTAPIIGARNVEQLEPSLRAATCTMTPELRAELSELSPAPPPATDRNEEITEHNFGAR